MLEKDDSINPNEYFNDLYIEGLKITVYKVRTGIKDLQVIANGNGELNPGGIPPGETPPNPAPGMTQ